MLFRRPNPTLPKVLLPSPVVKMPVPTSWVPSIPSPKILTQGRGFVTGQFRVSQTRRFVAPPRLMNEPIPALIPDEVELAQIVSGRSIIPNYNKVLKRQPEEPTALEAESKSPEKKRKLGVLVDGN